MNYTQNYQLPQWVETDRILMDDFNDSYEKLDAALKTNADGLSANSAAIAANDAQHSGFGNCQLYTASYVGTGATGYETPNTLTFPSQPLVVFIAPAAGSESAFLLAVQGMPSAYTQARSGDLNQFSWSGNTLSWYTNTAGGAQMNTSGVTYRVAAPLDKDAA